MAQALPTARIGQSGVSRSVRIFIKRYAIAYVLVLPVVLARLAFTLIPVVQTFWWSFTDKTFLGPQPTWVGLLNYADMLKDPSVSESLDFTVIYTVASTLLSVLLGLGIALLLNQRIKALAFFRTMYYLPACVSGVSVAMIWLWMFSGDYGLLNQTLRLVGIQGPYWLTDVRTVLPAFILMSLWGIGGGIIIYLAGLQNIPTELYEAADVDGAGEVVKFWHVTLPMLSPVLFFQLVMGIIGALQVFAGPFIMTQGGPAYASLFYMLYLYQNAFSFFRMGYASALAWVLFIYIVALTALTFRGSALWVFYAGEVKRK